MYFKINWLNKMSGATENKLIGLINDRKIFALWMHFIFRNYLYAVIFLSTYG